MTQIELTVLEMFNHFLQKHPELAANFEQVSLLAQGKTFNSSTIDDWARRGFAAPSPHFIKQTCLQRNATPNAIWIETGTYLGETTEFLSAHSTMVYSIEPEPALYLNAVKKFESFNNVQIINGLSEEVFLTLLPKLSGDINLWLDGHYSAGITFKGPKDTPIVDELNCISNNKSNFEKVSVFIDDVHCFNPHKIEYAEYPSIDYLVDWARQNKFYWHIEHDIFIAKNH